MIADSELAGLGLTAQQITDLKAAVASQLSEPKFSVVLEQYAPEWTPHGIVPYGPYPKMSVKPMPNLIAGGAISALCWNSGNATLNMFTLPNEDAGTQSWNNSFQLHSVTGVRSVSQVESGAGQWQGWFLRDTTYGELTKMAPEIGFQVVVSGNSALDLRHCAAVAPDNVHMMALTTQGNWRLCYWDGSNRYDSDIYWPYQVRSFDAIRTGLGYDVIALITDLPPIADYTVNGMKLTKTEQRVQGIVLFKYYPDSQVWSEHHEFEVVDNDNSPVGDALANLTLATFGNEFFMVYAKRYGNYAGLAITKSRDGISWENPIPHRPFGQTYSYANDLPPFCLARMSQYMYLFSSGYCYRSPATAFMGRASTSFTQDITDYVLNVSVKLDQSRSATVSLGDANGELSAGLLGKMPIGLKATVSLGYQTASGPVMLPIVTGVVATKRDSQSLPKTNFDIDIIDALAMLNQIGSPVAQEWQSLIAYGDTFAPITANDAIGSSGLGGVAIWDGSWLGGPDDSTRYRGLNMLCNREEGSVVSATMSRVFCGQVSGELSFYKKSALPDMPAGTTMDDTLAGTEYAGIFFRAMDSHNLYYVRFEPYVASSGNHYHRFAIVKRTGQMVQTEPNVWQQQHTDTVLATSYLTASWVSHGYAQGYAGRITVRWRYGRIEVWRNLPGSLPEAIFADATAFELPGAGNYGYWSTPSSFERSMLAGSVGFLAYSPKDGYKHLEKDATGQGSTYWLNQSGGTHASVTAPIRPNSNVTRVIQMTTGAKTGDNPGCFFDSNADGNLGIPQKTELAIEGWVYLASGDDSSAGEMTNLLADVRLYYASGEQERLYTAAISEKSQWVNVAWTTTTRENDTLNRIEVRFRDRRESTHITATTVWYVSEFTVKQKLATESYVYVANVDSARIGPIYSISDAVKTMLCYAGQHNVSITHLIDDDFSSQRLEWSMTNIGLFDGAAMGTGKALLAERVAMPFIVDITAGWQGRLILSEGTTTGPYIYLNWNGYSELELIVAYSYFDATVVRSVPFSGGPDTRLKVLCTSQVVEGYRVITDTSREPYDYVTVAVYHDDRLVMCHTVPITAEGGWQERVGFASINGVAQVELSAITINNLRRPAGLFSIDPGDSVGTALGRLVGISHMTLMSRHADTTLITRQAASGYLIRVSCDSYTHTLTSDFNLGQLVTAGNAIFLEAVQDGLLNNHVVLTVAEVFNNAMIRVTETITSETGLYKVFVLPAPLVVTERERGAEINALPAIQTRLTGARDVIDVYDERLTQRIWRHTFAKVDDPNLMTGAELADERAFILEGGRTAANRKAMTVKFDPVREYGDLVYWHDQVWLVDGLSATLQKGPNDAPTLIGQMTLNEI